MGWLKALWRRRYRITPAGALFVLAAGAVAAAAAVSANNLLFLILAMMLSTLLVSGFVSRLCLAGLELDFQAPEHISAGRTMAAGLAVRNLKRWMPSFSIRVVGVEDSGPPALLSAVYFPVIPGGATLAERVEVLFPRRGVYRQNSFSFTTRFPFGFLEKSARVTLRREIVVYPSIDPLPGFEELLAEIGGDIESHYQGLGRDFYRIRPYEALESSRHVDWKATAKTGDLQVREFAREREESVELFLDRDVPRELENWFERAVACCAFLCWRLSEKSTSIRLRSQGFDFRLPEEGDIYTILRYLALVTPQPGRPPEPPLDETSFPILVTPAPEKFAVLGWGAARVVGVDDLRSAAGGPEPRAAQNFHHGG